MGKSTILRGVYSPEDKNSPRYAQLYLYDHAEALRMRTQKHPDLNKDILEGLQTLIETTSPYVGC